MFGLVKRFGTKQDAKTVWSLVEKACRVENQGSRTFLSSTQLVTSPGKGREVASMATRMPMLHAVRSRVGLTNATRCYSTGFGRSWRRSFPEVPEQTALYGLMAANVAVFLAWRGDVYSMTRHFTTSWDAVRAGRVHTLLLSAFSQRDSWHLFSNMLGLYFFGRNVAFILGGSGLIALYLAGGVFGCLVLVAGQAWQDGQEARKSRGVWYGSEVYRSAHTPSLGSSGAVNAIVIFEIMMVPTATVLIYGILPVPAWILGGLFLFQDVSGAFGVLSRAKGTVLCQYFALTDSAQHGSSNIGYTAHLGGAAVGALTYLGVRRGRIPTRWGRWR